MYSPIMENFLKNKLVAQLLTSVLRDASEQLGYLIFFFRAFVCGIRSNDRLDYFSIVENFVFKKKPIALFK